MIAAATPARAGLPTLPRDASPGEGTGGRPPVPTALKIQVFSDLHLDVAAATVPERAPHADVVVVAGDTCAGASLAFAILRSAIPRPTPIVAVLGNHEHYRNVVHETIDEARTSAACHDITFLENDATVIEGTRFVGATLWTDFRLEGGARRAATMAHARAGMNDHRKIAVRRSPLLRFLPEDAAAQHETSRVFLQRTLGQRHDGPTVVVTHHAPHALSIHPRYELDTLNAAFASDMDELIVANGPSLWIHGHVHSSFDYTVGSTRILCNPHGYGGENKDFRGDLVVEVPR